MRCFSVKSIYFCALCFILLAVSAAGVSAESPRQQVKTTIIYDGPEDGTAKKIERLRNEILELTAGEFDVIFPASKVINGMWDMSVIKKEIETAVNDPDTDFIICLGLMASHEICRYNRFDKPVIAADILDANLQGLSSKNDWSTTANLNYLISTGNFLKGIEQFRDIKSFKTLTVVINRNLSSELPFLPEFFSASGNKISFSTDIIFSEDTAESVLSKISDKTEALLLTPSLRLSEVEFKKLADGISQKKLPAFTITGKNELAKGLLAALAPGIESKTKLRRIALNFQRILLGEKPESLSTIFSEDRKLAINMKTARITGIYPPSTILTEADLIKETISPKAGKLTLLMAIDEAMGKNLSIARGKAVVESGEEDIRRARSYLIPNIEANLTGVRIDENSAKISFGTESEETLKGSLTATQVLFSEKAWAGWRAVKSGQKAREEEYQAILLDTAYDVSQSYINVLRAQTLENVRKSSIDLTTANLKRARLRRSVGTAAASEVYRWESELAMQKKDLIDAKATVRQAKNNLNRLLNRPIHEDFSVEEITFSNPVLCVSNENFVETISNPVKYDILKQFLVKKGLDASPELKGINAAIKAQERLTTSAKRDFFLPSVALQGKVNEIYGRDGFDETDLDPTKDRDKTSWSVAINASFPLFTGGAKTADYLKAKAETKRLRFEKKNITAQLEEKIRFTVEAAKASYGAIKHSRKAAEAARKNLNLVTDAYSRGVVSIIELLDAQNASTSADLGSENSVYDFMADLLAVQRSIGKLDFSKPADARQKLRDDFNASLKKYTEM